MLVGKEVPAGYSMKNGCFLYYGKLVILKHSPKTMALIKEFHNSLIGGHLGYLRTFKRLSEVVYREGMKKDIQEQVAKYEICQRNKYEALSPAGLLQPLPIPLQVWRM